MSINHTDEKLGGAQGENGKRGQVEEEAPRKIAGEEIWRPYKCRKWKAVDKVKIRREENVAGGCTQDVMSWKVISGCAGKERDVKAGLFGKKRARA